VGEEIKRELARMIHEELKDPRIKGLISITDVEVTNDLRYARVYVSIMANPEEQAITLQVLENAGGYFRSELAKILSTRLTPELVFQHDQSLAYGARINQILAGFKKENGEK